MSNEEHMLTVRLPFSGDLLKITDISDINTIVAGLRGPDNGSIGPKILGSSVLRGLISGYEYGVILPVDKLRELLSYETEKSVPEILAKRIIEAQFHYCNHVADAFDQIRRRIVVDCSKDRDKYENDILFFSIMSAIFEADIYEIAVNRVKELSSFLDENMDIIPHKSIGGFRETKVQLISWLLKDDADNIVVGFEKKVKEAKEDLNHLFGNFLKYLMKQESVSFKKGWSLQEFINVNDHSYDYIRSYNTYSKALEDLLAKESE